MSTKIVFQEAWQPWRWSTTVFYQEWDQYRYLKLIDEELRDMEIQGNGDQESMYGMRVRFGHELMVPKKPFTFFHEEIIQYLNENSVVQHDFEKLHIGAKEIHVES